MIVFISVLFVIAVGLYSYFLWAKRFLPISWKEAHLIEKINKGQEWGSALVGNQNRVGLFSGPQGSRQQKMHRNLVHLPMQIFRVVKLVLLTIPILQVRLIYNRLSTGSSVWNPNISGDKIFDLVINSVLLLVAKVSEDGAVLQINIPSNIPLETRAGFKPAGLKLSLSISNRSIISAVWDGKEVTNDTDLIACFVVLSIIGWGHPQSHVLSEKSAREIAQKNIKTLEPSSRYVLALHEGLLYSPISPVDDDDHFFNSMVIRQSLIDSAFVRIPHNLDRRKMNFKYYNFLYRSRGILIKLIDKYKLDVNAEWLFNNMIVHSIDHYCAYKYIGRFKSWTMDGSKSITSYFRAKMFWSIWLPDYESFVESQRIGKMNAKKYPFYHELYEELTLIDEGFANCILASTSF